MIAALAADGLLAVLLAAVVLRHRRHVRRSATAYTEARRRAEQLRAARVRDREQFAAELQRQQVDAGCALAAEHERLVCAERDRDEWKAIARAWQDRSVDRLPRPVPNPVDDDLVEDAMAGLDEWLADLTGGAR